MKKIAFAVILTLFVNILCLPLWTGCDYGDFVRTFFNKEARVDLLYHGKITGSEPFQYKVTPQPFYASWLYDKDSIHRANLSLRARGGWQKLSLWIKSERDGKITLKLRGPWVDNDYGHLYSVLTDWRNLKVNGTALFGENKALSFRKCFSKQISVRKDEILHIEADFRRHHFTTHDFTFLKHGTLWYLITGNLLFFFLMRRLISYFSKRCGGVFSSVDTLLVVTFFSLISIPAIDISDEVKSVREDRMLAVKPSLKEILRGNANTGGIRPFPSFSDHFCGRNILVKLHDVVRNKFSRIIRTKKVIYFKENGWMFFTPVVWDRNYSSGLIQSVVHNLVQLDRFCQHNKIKFYVLESPKKESIYKDVPKIWDLVGENLLRLSHEQEVLRTEVRKHHISYVYPYGELLAARNQDLVFFKWKHHWTDWGAFTGYRELMKEVRKDFPDMPVVSLGDYRESKNSLIRDEYWRCYDPAFHFYKYFNNASMDDPPNRVFYNYYDHKNSEKLVVQIGKFKKDFTYPEGKHKVMLIGNSPNENLLQFLPYSAAETKYIRLNGGQVRTGDEFKIMKLYKKDILAFKPEILILSIDATNLYRLRDICLTK